MKQRIIALLAALATFAQERAEKLRTGLEALPEADLPKRFEEVVDAFVECANGAYVNANAGKNGDPALIARVHAALEELKTIVQGQKSDEVLTKANAALEEARKIQFESLLGAKLTEAKLPKEAEALVREHFAGRVAAAADVDARITRVREAFAAFAQVGKVTMGGPTVGRDTEEKIVLACEALLGVKASQQELAKQGIKPLRGIREAYQLITGDQDCSELPVGGFYKTAATIVTGDFPQILKNSMTKRLLQDYAEVSMGGLEQLITEDEVGDFKTQERVRMGYLGDLPIVAENAAYLEMTKPTDEIVSFAVAKRGGFLDITWETILNDDLRKIAAFPERLARSARRTLKQFITDFFINNPNFDADATAWFAAGHSNLGSAALSDAELDAREIAIMKQAEKDSSKRLGLPLDWIMVPVDLKASAMQINNNNDGANSWYQRFGADARRIIVNELLTDVTDWYYGTMPANAPFLEINYLRGFRTPQIFVVPLERRREVTAIDKIQIYGIYVFGGDIIDYRGVGKNVVAG